MQRIPEPELMDEAEQARAYAMADFAEPNARFVGYFETEFPELLTGSVLDLGCGPGDIVLRLATRRTGLVRQRIRHEHRLRQPGIDLDAAQLRSIARAKRRHGGAACQQRKRRHQNRHCTPRQHSVLLAAQRPQRSRSVQAAGGHANLAASAARLASISMRTKQTRRTIPRSTSLCAIDGRQGHANSELLNAQALPFICAQMEDRGQRDGC
jgi:SAM-dependent methyltransferase